MASNELRTIADKESRIRLGQHKRSAYFADLFPYIYNKRISPRCFDFCALIIELQDVVVWYSLGTHDSCTYLA